MSDRERVRVVADWLDKKYGDEYYDGPPGYWEFQARELLSLLTPSAGPAADETLPEVQCPSCGATIRARMSDQSAADEALDGAGLIRAERRRQVEEEGWTPAHDVQNAADDLAFAAVCYAMPSAYRWLINLGGLPRWWPWRRQDWKPTPNDRARELVKAGALIAAEIDRLHACEAAR